MMMLMIPPPTKSRITHGYTIAGKHNLTVNTTVDPPTADALRFIATLESQSPLNSPPGQQKQ